MLCTPGPLEWHHHPQNSTKWPCLLSITVHCPPTWLSAAVPLTGLPVVVASCMPVPPNLRGGPILWNPWGTGSAIWAYGRGGRPDVFVSPISFFSFLDGKNACIHSLPSILLVFFVSISHSWQFLLVYYSIHGFIFMYPYVYICTLASDQRAD